MWLIETVYRLVMSIRYPATCLLHRLILTNKTVWPEEPYKYRQSYAYVFMACKEKSQFFKHDSVRGRKI